jgi:NAD(P)-dependent dehydrogenase (short-subunit alcohol dehydrogenase family)
VTCGSSVVWAARQLRHDGREVIDLTRARHLAGSTSSKPEVWDLLVDRLVDDGVNEPARLAPPGFGASPRCRSSATGATKAAVSMLTVQYANAEPSIEFNCAALGSRRPTSPPTSGPANRSRKPPRSSCGWPPSARTARTAPCTKPRGRSPGSRHVR